MGATKKQIELTKEVNNLKAEINRLNEVLSERNKSIIEITEKANNLFVQKESAIDKLAIKEQKISDLNRELSAASSEKEMLRQLCYFAGVPKSFIESGMYDFQGQYFEDKSDLDWYCNRLKQNMFPHQWHP